MLDFYIPLLLITSAYILYNERNNRTLNTIIWLVPNILFAIFYFPIYFVAKGYKKSDGSQALNIWLRIAIAAGVLYVFLWFFLQVI